MGCDCEETAETVACGEFIVDTRSTLNDRDEWLCLWCRHKRRCHSMAAIAAGDVDDYE